MAYKGKLINRLAQFGKVSYDLVVEDDAGILPLLRHSVSLPDARDTPAVRAALVSKAVADAADEQTPAAKRARLQAMRDEAEDARRQAIERRDQLQARLDRGDV